MHVYDKTTSGVFVLSNIQSIAKSAIFDALPSAGWRTEGLKGIRHCMRKVPLVIILLILLSPACSHKSASNARVVRPKYHHRWYDRKKDKKTSRTKTMRMKG